MAFLIDTNVISELKRPRPEERVVRFLDQIPKGESFISSVTLAEIRFGIGKMDQIERRIDLENWLNHSIRPMFRERVLEVTEDVLFRWILLSDSGRKAGLSRAAADLFLAATAMEYDLTLVTRNVRDFLGLEVTIFNPWESPA